jgi:hypothetical protein
LEDTCVELGRLAVLVEDRGLAELGQPQLLLVILLMHF